MITVGKTETKYYKHSLSECGTKIEGIKKILGMIKSSEDITTTRMFCTSAEELCNELLREIQN